MDEQGEIGLDDLNRRLAEIDAALDGEFSEPSAQQFALLTERDRLRHLAARYWSSRDATRETEALEAELRELVRRRKTEVSSRSGYVMAKGGNNQGPAPGAWVTLSAQSRNASDVARLTIRIGEIESELERRRAAEASS
ncbi:MAG TPA: hypothetical protein VEB69_10980 [Acidimicrobiia bacterium]|nr:hypothetical protein [Acidimicrobiia bacterium]